MRRIILMFVLGCALVPPAIHAQPYPGVALRWNHCNGEGTGLETRDFACNTNAGFEELVGSFSLASDIANASGNEIVVDLQNYVRYAYMPVPSPGTPLPEWWKFKQAGTCRQNALSVNFVVDPANAVCQDWGQGAQVGGIGAYNVEFRGPGTARILMVEAVAPSSLQSLLAGVEYYSFTLRIRHDKTVGTGACGGCGAFMLVVLSYIKVTTPDPANDRLLSGPLNGYDSDFVTWNESPVPVRTASWGALKALYR